MGSQFSSSPSQAENGELGTFCGWLYLHDKMTVINHH